MLLLELHQRTLLVPLKNFYGECAVLIHDAPEMHLLQCLKIPNCAKNANCLDKIARRCVALLDAFPSAERLIVYFKYRHRESVGGAIFWKDWRTAPRLIGSIVEGTGANKQTYVLNPSGLAHLQKKAVIREWRAPQELFLPTPRTPTLDSSLVVLNGGRVQLVGVGP